MRLEGEKRSHLEISDELAIEIHNILKEGEVVLQMRQRAGEAKRSVNWTDVSVVLGNRFAEMGSSSYMDHPSINGLVEEFNEKSREIFGFIEKTLPRSQGRRGRDDYERINTFASVFKPKAN